MGNGVHLLLLLAVLCMLCLVLLQALRNMQSVPPPCLLPCPLSVPLSSLPQVGGGPLSWPGSACPAANKKHLVRSAYNATLLGHACTEYRQSVRASVPLIVRLLAGRPLFRHCRFRIFNGDNPHPPPPPNQKAGARGEAGERFRPGSFKPHTPQLVCITAESILDMPRNCAAA